MPAEFWADCFPVSYPNVESWRHAPSGRARVELPTIVREVVYYSIGRGEYWYCVGSRREDVGLSKVDGCAAMGKGVAE